MNKAGLEDAIPRSGAGGFRPSACSFIPCGIPSVRVKQDTLVLSEWKDLSEELKDQGAGVVYLLGAPDQGKTTFCRFLVQELSADAITGFLDCDTGQSTIGPPATVGLALYAGTFPEQQETFLRFVGSIAPSGHQVPELVAAARLLATARARMARYVIIDSPGWVGGPAAVEFQIRMIDLLSPGMVVAFCRGPELGEILVNFRHRPGMSIHRFFPHPAVRTRTRGWRSEYRTRQFKAYFAESSETVVSLAGIGMHGRIPERFCDDDWQGLLLALCDHRMMVIALAVVESVDTVHHTLHIRTPAQDPGGISSIHIGSLYLDPETGRTTGRHRHV